MIGVLYMSQKKNYLIADTVIFNTDLGNRYI